MRHRTASTSSFRWHRAAPWLFAWAAALAACGTRGPLPGSDPFSGAGTAAEVRVRVRNGNFYDATLTAVSDTGRRRLGTVGGNQTAVFSMPWTFTGALRIQIDLLAGPTCTTEAITVSPGETVDLEIRSDANSMFCR